MYLIKMRTHTLFTVHLDCDQMNIHVLCTVMQSDRGFFVLLTINVKRVCAVWRCLGATLFVSFY